MIIFNLDGTLADCEHRRHLVQKPHCYHCGNNEDYGDMVGCYCMKEKFIPDWKAFYESCNRDKLIQPTSIILLNLWIKEGEEIEIWSGRCESIRHKTEKWLKENIFTGGREMCPLKMRPIGDSSPDDVLKERWIDEHLAAGGEPIQFVFDDRPKVVRMWRRRGIFVFDCNQTGEEF